MEVVRLFFFRAERLPFVKAACGNEAAAFSCGIAKGREFEDRLGPRVDKRGFFVFRPGRNEAPAKLIEREFVFVPPEYGAELCRSDIETAGPEFAVLFTPAFFDLFPEAIGEFGAFARERVEGLKFGRGVLTRESAALEILVLRLRFMRQLHSP